MNLSRKFLVIISVFALSLGAGSKALALPIQVFNTGVNSSGNVLGDGAIDSHYNILIGGTPSGVVINQSSIPGTWLANNATSKWIWQTAVGQPVNVDRTFRTSFDMTGLDTTTAVLAGRWSVDNFGLDILVNGISLGVTNPGFNTWSAFSVSSALLLSGMNTIDFVARDVGGIAGFRAEFTSASASASVPDAASTLALLGLTLSGLAAWNTRKSKLS